MKSITIVEDKGMVREYVSRYLSEQGHKVIAYEKYEDFKETNSDLYLLDHDMRGYMSGSKFLAKTNIDPNKLILMSGLDSWKDTPCKAKIKKPFKMDDLGKLL